MKPTTGHPSDASVDHPPPTSPRWRAVGDGELGDVEADGPDWWSADGDLSGEGFLDAVVGPSTGESLTFVRQCLDKLCETGVGGVLGAERNWPRSRWPRSSQPRFIQAAGSLAKWSHIRLHRPAGSASGAQMVAKGDSMRRSRSVGDDFAAGSQLLAAKPGGVVSWQPGRSDRRPPRRGCGRGL